MKLALALIMIFAAALALSACTATPYSTPSATPPPAGTQAPNPVPPLTTPPPGGAATFGQLAQAGQNVFAANCAGCHGNSGQGGQAPALIGSNAALGKYNTAKGLLDFISLTMPARAPGSLPRQDYLGVLSYLLVQNNYAFPTTAFNESQLPGIALK